MDPEVRRILEELKDLFGKDDLSPRERKAALKVKAETLVLEKKNITEIQKASKAVKDHSKELGLSKEEIKEWDDAINSSVKQHKRYEKSLRDVGSAVLGFGRAAAQGEGSISAFTDNLKGFNIIGDSFANLGQRLDTNIETFRQLSQTGANFGQSIVQMRQAAGQALLPLDDFASLVASNSQNLAALFGSTTAGARGIANLSEGLRKVGTESLAPLGFTVDEINETMLLNLERQRRTFNFDANATQTNIQSAINFAKQLDRLAKLTGTQREELQRQIEQQMSNERFQAMLTKQTDATRIRLEAFAGTIGSLSPELAEGFQDLIANSGRPVTEAAIALVQNMPEAQAAIQNLIAGTTTSEQALISIRNASIRSQDRFNKATVTGTVDFLRLQGGVIRLATTNMDLNSVLEEQAKTATGLTSGLTTFQEATKRLSGQFQKIETGLLASFGPALGGLSRGLQGIMGGLGGIANILAGIPALTGTAIAGIIVGRYLFDKAAQVAIVTTGVRLGTAHLAGAGMGPGMFGGKSAKGMAGKIGRFGLTRALPAAGAVIGGASSLGMVMDKDKKNDSRGWGGIAGTVLGGIAGFMMGGPPGALIGASLGSMAGQAAGGTFGGPKAVGGPMDAGKSYLVHKDEIITPGTHSTAVAKSDVTDILNTKYEAMEKHLATMVTEMRTGNKLTSSSLESLNTSNAIDKKIMTAVERTARTNPHQIGLVS